mmetsp:Transcript_145567/g.363029  ORF Transcript_145567/g.363029 Transcript_145567/m.363029 type:complete len:263 (+) Transcript_145567:60-848(+)|eukprot:CAMPEP_0115188354 /NCGR_PEP_ID=MMETSP0270-20121206/10966_1 /TAXON_ID=71861 /ORGANISM="Scrippsiella trochoidea, Strain CCMP3099" /LENGTH=262 /DNA_ID=CAMNT_0002601531 /DNA_START=53 /DNA_END=841 /DNA_ORIENTATION=+
MAAQVSIQPPHLDEAVRIALPWTSEADSSNDVTILSTHVSGNMVGPCFGGVGKESLVCRTTVPRVASAFRRLGSDPTPGNVDPDTKSALYIPGEILRRSARLGPTPSFADAEVTSEISTADTMERATTEGGASPKSDGSPAWITAAGAQWPSPMEDAPSQGVSMESTSACPTKQADWASGFLPACPSIGSQAHDLGTCKPCAFVFKGGCANGMACTFCHLCTPGEKKRRKKERLLNRKGRHGVSYTAEWSEDLWNGQETAAR